MNKVFPRKWYNQIDRSLWGKGPWDSELEDREQWSDSMTGYPCLAIRCEIGVWAGYVAVYPTHPAFGEKVDDSLGTFATTTPMSIRFHRAAAHRPGRERGCRRSEGVDPGGRANAGLPLVVRLRFRARGRLDPEHERDF
jgi:hypothetical protein